MDRIDGVTIATKVENGIEAYCVAKILADRAVWDWVVANPSTPFDIVSLHPSYTFGRTLYNPTAQPSGMNAYLWLILTSGIPSGAGDSTVHVSDVSRAHILALDKTRVPGDQRLFVTASPFDWKQVLEYAKNKWPQRKWAEAETPTYQLKRDISRTDIALGIQWKTIEQQVDDVVEQLIAFDQ